MSALAKAHSSHIILPLLERDGAGFYNRAYLIGPDGEPIGHYDKIHPTLAEREQLGVVGGKSIDIFETSHGRVAIPICYDIYFPELFAALALREPDILFFPRCSAPTTNRQARRCSRRAPWIRKPISPAPVTADAPTNLGKRASCLDSRPLSIPTAPCWPTPVTTRALPGPH